METTRPRRADRHVHRDRPRKVSLLILLLVLGGFVAALVLASRYYEGCKGAADGPARDVSFTVEEGATADQVVDRLASEQVIPCGGFVGNLLMRGTGKSSEITGRHLLPHDRDDPRRGGRGAHHAAEGDPHR